MAYADFAKPKLLVGSFSNAGLSVWTYESTYQASDLDAPYLISDAGDLGMKAGDVILATDTDASPPLVSSHRVVSITRNATYPYGAATLSVGVSLSGATGT